MNRKERSETLDDLLAQAVPPTPADVDRVFLLGGRKVFAAAGCDPLAFLTANPGVSKTELAKRLASQANIGVRKIEMIMAIYEEAANRGLVRETAKDLLIREILTKFPEGWCPPYPLGKLANWDWEIKSYIADSKPATNSFRIIRELTIDHPPPEGWKPEPQNDPLIDELFDRHWPLSDSSI